MLVQGTLTYPKTLSLTTHYLRLAAYDLLLTTHLLGHRHLPGDAAAACGGAHLAATAEVAVKAAGQPEGRLPGHQGAPLLRGPRLGASRAVAGEH